MTGGEGKLRVWKELGAGVARAVGGRESWGGGRGSPPKQAVFPPWFSDGSLAHEIVEGVLVPQVAIRLNGVQPRLRALQSMISTEQDTNPAISSHE